MSAGTIAVTSGSSALTGTGTSFTTDLKVGDFIGVIAGGTPYTLIVASITSNTQLTIGSAFAGPTATGLAWSAVPASLLYAVTQQIMNDMGTALRGMNSQLVNWQKIYSDSASVTVERPDKTTFTGPSWGYIATQFSGKLDKAQNLNDVANKATAWNNIAVYGTAANTAAQGNDSRLNTVDGKTGGTVSTPITVNQSGNYAVIADTLVAEGNGSYNSRALLIKGRDTANDIQVFYRLLTGTYQAFRLVQNATETFRAQNNGACYAVSFNPTSDSNLKFNKKFLTNALANTLSTRGMSYNIQGEIKAGIIAQDVEKFMPEAVTVNTDPVVLEDATILEKTKSLDYSAVAGLHTEAIKDLVKLMLLCMESPDEAKLQLQALATSINTSMEDENKTDMKMEWALLNPPLSQSEDEAEEQASDTDERAE